MISKEDAKCDDPLQTNICRISRWINKYGFSFLV